MVWFLCLMAYLLKFTLVSNNSGARGYLPKTIFVGVSYLLLDFCFFVVLLLPNKWNTSCVERCPDVLLRYLTGSYLMSKLTAPARKKKVCLL